MFLIQVENNLSCKSVSILGKGHFPSLTCLYIGQNGIGDQGMRNFSKIYFPNLTDIVFCKYQ